MFLNVLEDGDDQPEESSFRSCFRSHGVPLWSQSLDKTSTGAGVAAANWIRICLAAALILWLVVAHRTNQRSLVGFLVPSFTYEGWVSLRNGLTDLPRALLRRRPAGGVPWAVLAFVVAVVLLVVTVRAGEQVFAALDPDFTRDAWGGPSYPGASLAHWLDGVRIFYAGIFVLARHRLGGSEDPMIGSGDPSRRTSWPSSTWDLTEGTPSQDADWMPESP
jgi:hypothetical protein